MNVEKTSATGTEKCNKRKSSDDVEIDNSQQVLKKIATLYAEKLMNDICLVVGDIEYPAHRLILCTSSEVFQVMLMNPLWTESQENRIVLQEAPQCAYIFGEFLRYFYTGQIRISQTTIMGILTLADKYMVKDLILLCIEYMYNHIAEATVYGQITAWFQYTLTLGHFQVSQEERMSPEVWKDEPEYLYNPITDPWELLRRGCRNFIKFNFEMVANTEDFLNFNPDVIASLLQQNDLVVHSEMVLYDYTVKWLDAQRARLAETIADEQKLDERILHLVDEVMTHVRFPMMNSRQLALLLLSPLVTKYKHFFFDKLAVGVAFHNNAGKDDPMIMKVLKEENGDLYFTPRLYTSEQWSTSIAINSFSAFQSYTPRTLVCTTPVTLRDCVTEQHCEWVIDLFPKGVCYPKCYQIVWHGTTMVPEVVMRTVRLSLRCRDPPAHSGVRVKIAALVSGITCDIESIVEVAHCVRTFTQEENCININDLLSYQKLNDRFNSLCPKFGDGISETPYLVGDDRDTLKVRVVVVPLCELSRLEEPYNSSSVKY